MSGKFQGNSGDWICPDPQCANVNFARRDACNRCGFAKEVSVSAKALSAEIGKAAAEKSKGLFSADDWQCSKCGNVNWARRSTCNVCNAPKIGDIEERTGYGGGYNEREGVEYIERDDSDGEFDEFGRRKKKFRKSLNENEKVTPTPDKQEKENEDESEEEEEDDDEDGDLSKYDVGSWSEVDEVKSKKDETRADTKPDRRSHSRSSSSNSDSSHSHSPLRDRKARSKRSQRRGRDRSSSSSRSRSRSRSQTRK